MTINIKSLYNHFEILEDHRDTRGKKHEQIDILIMTVYGVLCGYTDFTNLADFVKVHENYFNELLDLKNGTPSHDTLSNVFSIIEQIENQLRPLIELEMMLKKLPNIITY